MYRRTSRFCWSRAMLSALLDCLDTRPPAALLTTPTITLFKTGPTPGPDSTVGQFTAVPTHGITPAAITLAGPVNLLNNDQAMVASPQFVVTSGGTLAPDVAIGWYLGDGVAAYYGGELFDTPVPFNIVGDFLDLDVILPLNIIPSFSAA